MYRYRFESDSIGTLPVEADALYGVQSQRAYQNFRITGRRMCPEFLHNLALIKKAAAIVNAQAGELSEEKGRVIEEACDEIIAGLHEEAFIVDPVQGGAGTSANMNMNEVIANLAGAKLDKAYGSYLVHPNDDVNRAQSTNDTIPTAGKMTVVTLSQPLLKELYELEKELKAKAQEFRDVIKMGRTQLEDAVPMTLGETFGSYASLMHRCRLRLIDSLKEMETVNLGGTAIGSGINASPYYMDHIVPELSELFHHPLYQADDLFDATENLDSFAAVSGSLKACALSLSKMCNDLRLLASGPRCGLHEINLPAMQNGSSIMPGKVNPVIPEVVSQAAFLVIGHDTTITMAAEAGQMELNAFEPVVFYQLFESIQAMSGAVATLNRNCIAGISANAEHCESLAENSVGIATALCPEVGYQKAASVARKALKEGKSVRQIVVEEGLMNPVKASHVLDLHKAAGFRP